MSLSIIRSLACVACAALLLGPVACIAEAPPEEDPIGEDEALPEEIAQSEDELAGSSGGNSCSGAAFSNATCYQPGCAVSCPANMIASCLDAGNCYASSCQCLAAPKEARASQLE